MCVTSLLIGLVCNILPLAILRFKSGEDAIYYISYGEAFKEVFKVVLASVVLISCALLIVYLHKNYKLIINRVINIASIILLSALPIIISIGYSSIKEFEQNQFIVELISYWNSNDSSYTKIENNSIMLSGKSIDVLNNIIIDMDKARSGEEYPYVYNADYSLIYLDSIDTITDDEYVTKDFVDYWQSKYKDVFKLGEAIVVIGGALSCLFILWLVLKSEEKYDYKLYKYINK